MKQFIGKVWDFEEKFYSNCKIYKKHIILSSNISYSELYQNTSALYGKWFWNKLEIELQNTFERIYMCAIILIQMQIQ